MDSVLVVAPRPRRLVSNPYPFTPHTRPLTRSPIRLFSPDFTRVISAKLDEDCASSSEVEHHSPRLNLPQEALEEFLSILRPAFPMPGSPTCRPQRVFSAGAMLQRPQPIRPLAVRLPEPEEEDSEREMSASPASELLAEPITSESPHRQGPHPSPISRNHTRNPFFRHPSYTYNQLNLSSATSPPPLSPTRVPLPLATVDELELEI